MTDTDAATFEGLTLSGQLEFLEKKLAGDDPRELLSLCATLRDAAPLSWLACKLLEGGWLGDGAARDWFAAFLGSLPDTSVHKVLRDTLAAGTNRIHLRDVLLAALERIPLARLSTLCLLDRALKHNFQDERDAHVASVTERCREAIARGEVAQFPLNLLAQVSGKSLPMLWEAAPDAAQRAAFDARRAELARRAIEVLGDAPKAVSQANAEELLARRVYTDPGHFLIELLQNAEDAGATIWRVHFDRDAVTVWHNGNPFDAKDLVGVTSIGQTTKRKQQIGFFGVGFKSVYEVTDRPRIYSDVYQFEIADVSIPKYLGQRPADVPADGTVLVLPLRDPDDPVRSPRALFEKARALDPCVLITLAGIDEIHLTLSEQGGGPEAHRLLEVVEQGKASWIRQEPLGWNRHYILRQATPRFTGGAREAGRADTTTIMVGLQTVDGVPVACADDAATVYSYLPTAESSGLRFFVQAHFDVPVDRERINPDSAWNRWILGRVPALLAEATTEIGTPAQAVGLLDVLPLTEELGSPAFRVVTGGLRRAFRDVACLPDTDGALRRPGDLLIAAPGLGALLEGAPLPSGQGTLLLPEADEATSARRVRVAASLGAKTFDVAALLEDVDAIAAGRAAAWFPRLHDVVLGEIEAQERGGSRLKAQGLLLKLRKLAVVPADDGRLHRPGLEGPGIPGEGLRPLFTGIRVQVDPALESGPLAERSKALLERLGVPELGLRELACALEASDDPAAQWGDRFDDVLAALARAPDRLRKRAAAIPMFPADGGRVALAGEGRDGGYVLEDPRLRELYAGRRAALNLPETGAEGLHAFVRASSVPALDVERLVQDVVDGMFSTSAEALSELHDVLEALGDDLSAQAWRRLGDQAIWPDREAMPRALRGTGAVRVPVQPSIAALFPEYHWLDEAIAERSHLRYAEPATVGADAVVEALERGRGAEFIRRASTYLVDHGSRLGAGARDRLAAAVAWIDDKGTPRPLGQLYHPEAPGRALFEAAGGTGGFLAGSGESWALLGAMGLRDRLRRLGAEEVLEQLVKVDGSRTLEGHPVLGDPRCRRWFYALLRDSASEVFTSDAARALLRQAPLFPTTQGTLLAPDALVMDDALPDLGVDWLPHDEIPRDVLELLRRHLNVGRPKLEEIVETHLRPALEAAAREQDGPRSARLLSWLAHEATDLTALRAWLPDIHIEASDGNFVPLSALVLPSAPVAPHLEEVFGDAVPSPSPRLDAAALALLGALGLPERPSGGALAEAMSAPSSRERGVALAALLSERVRALGAGPGLEGLPIATAPWLPDGTGVPRKPTALFAASPEVEALVGHEVALYPDMDAWRHLDDAVRARLGLRGEGDVTLDEVLAHVTRSRNRRVPVLLRVYEWMDRGLDSGVLARQSLLHAIGDQAVICTDDGEYYRPDQVVGELSFRLFGGWRGYWERGANRCPRLCKALGIVGEVTPTVVARFLREMADLAEARGGDTLLEQDPALPRMLLACYARLSDDEAVRLVPRMRPIILAQTGGRLTLVPVSDPGLYRSDTPTLEALFEETGNLKLAAKGAVEDRPAIDAFHAAVGVRMLRDKYRVMVVRSTGREVTDDKGRALVALRGSLRALCDVLPRVRLHRRELREAGWVFEERLRPLATSGAVRVIRNLAVRYVLPGVGTAETDAASAYDPGTKTLFIEEQVAEDVPSHATGLALGLLGCIYDGPGESQLLDIVELLLGRRTRAAMDANLDQKHYPRSEVSHSVVDDLGERLGELLDYGVGRRLAARFTQLEGVDLGQWREREVLDRALGEVGDETRAEVARRAAPHLLEAVGVTQPDADLITTLVSLLSSSSLTDLPEELAQPERAELPPLPDVKSAPAKRPRPKDFDELDKILAGFSKGPTIIRPADVPSAMDDLDEMAKRHPPAPTQASLDQQERLRESLLARREEEARRAESERRIQAAVEEGRRDEDAEGGLFDRVVRWFGFGEPANDWDDKLPAWAENDNPLTVTTEIGPQLWANTRARAEIAARGPSAAVAFDPPRLAVPYLYAAKVTGGSFDPDTQSWLPLNASGVQFAPSTPNGQRVVFEGVLEPGTSQLPMPLHSRLMGPPEVGGGEVEWTVREHPTRLEISYEGQEATVVRYEAELCVLPKLASVSLGIRAHAHLTRPTMDQHAFPIEVWRFLEEQGKRASLWERAVAVQSFVQSRYLYDDGFLDRPDVRTARSSLKAGEGNHHLQLLHASAGQDFLGRGICYELNAMVVELCRHLDVPAMVAAGWVLDDGRVDRPDHLFALAVLPSAQGASLFPLDAAVSDAGPRRPLRLQPTGPTVPAPSPQPGWSVPPPGAAQDVDQLIDGLREAELEALRRDFVVLEAALQQLGVHGGENYTVDDTPRLRSKLGRVLGSEAAVEVLLGVAEGPAKFSWLTPELTLLAGRGLISVRAEEIYEVTYDG